jgi:hypothetical protein
MDTLTPLSRRWEGGTEAGLRLEFKTEAENGLLLYTDNSAISHFLGTTTQITDTLQHRVL